jgi:lipopolysaccharide transport system permease protein
MSTREQPRPAGGEAPQYRSVEAAPAPDVAGDGDAPLPVTIIQPTRGWVSLELRELWAYRELLYFLTWRDVIVRYKQTVLGAGWAILQPISTMVVFTLFFGRLAKIPSDDLPYPIFSYAGLLPWTFFTFGLSQSAISLVNNASLVTRVFFPRLVIPLSAVIAGGVDFLLAFIVLLGMMVFYGITPGANVVFLIPLLMLVFVTSLGAGLWLSALNVKYRDVRYTLPFTTQLWLFATPIAYPSSLIEQPWRTFYGLNPMVGVVEGFRWALLGTDTRPGAVILASAAASVLVLLSGLYFFRRTERSFADII